MVKILLTGASGLLGREVRKEALRRNHVVVGLAFNRAKEDLIKCDLTNPEETTDIVKKIKPDVIIHTAAERFPDKVEKEYDKVKSLNIDTTGLLAQIANSLNSKFVYISTDYVFDGSSPPYKETDVPNPLNKYGLTKLEGEKASLSLYPDCSVLRIPILYGDVEYLAESAVTTIVSCVKSEKEQVLSHVEKRYPSSTLDIAQILCDMVPLLVNGSLKGIYQWSGKECLTKYEMALKIAKVFSLSHDHLKPQTEIESSTATRPLNSCLDNSRLESLGISHHTPFEEGMKSVLAKWIY